MQSQLPEMSDVLSFLFQFFIVFVIGLLGALVSDFWYYYRHRQNIDLKEDLIVGIVDSVITNLIVGIFEYNGWPVVMRIVITASFLGGLWGIDILSILMNPNKVFIIFKNVFKSHKNDIVEGINNGIEEIENGNKPKNDKQKRKESKNNARSNNKPSNEDSNNVDNDDSDNYNTDFDRFNDPRG